jgi:curli biogenesis system outer membrane secretion channel CsgG
MTRIPLILTLAAAAALAGCNKENHTIVAGPDVENDANTSAPKTPVALPPSIVASKIYRCADNKVIYVDYLSDNKSANVRTDKGAASTLVTAAEAGKPMTAAGGYSVDGNATASTAKIAVPGHPSQSCKA